jgi:hypothetical protein
VIFGILKGLIEGNLRQQAFPELLAITVPSKNPSQRAVIIFLLAFYKLVFNWLGLIVGRGVFPRRRNGKINRKI